MSSLRRGIGYLTGMAQNLIRVIGIGGSWLNPLLIALVMIDVISRYIWGESAVWVAELEWHLFAIVFLLGASYTMQSDKHVRVDVFYQKSSPTVQSGIDLAGHVFLLIPLCLFMIPPAWDYFIQSWQIGEGSGDPGGIPALYPIKAVIPLSFLLVLIQTIAHAIDLLMGMVSPAHPKSS